MKNAFFDYFQSRIQIKVTGKNMERFIKRLVTLGIMLYDIQYKKYNEVLIIINLKDYQKVLEVKTVYEINPIRVLGMAGLKKWLKRNVYFFLFLGIGLFLFFFLTHLTFEVEIVHNDSNLRNLLKEELKENGISKGKWRKDYDQIEKIKQKILEKYKNKIEWLELEREGTKYIVRVEERLLNEEKPIYENQDIVAKKSAILLKVEAESGEIIKNKNDYVKAGETVIRGNIMLDDKVKKQIPAKGRIYGEVWYKTTVEYPLDYQEDVETGKQNTVFTIRFLNHRFELFNFHKFKYKKIESKTLVKSNVFPISFTKEVQKEVNHIEQHLTKKDALKKAEEVAVKKIKSKLRDKEKIIKIQQLKVDQNKRTIIVEFFFTVMEDITAIHPNEKIEQPIE